MRPTRVSVPRTADGGLLLEVDPVFVEQNFTTMFQCRERLMGDCYTCISRPWRTPAPGSPGFSAANG